MALDFYHGHGSPFSWRVWLALEHKQVPYELKVLSFQAGDTRKPEFVAVNPRGHVPTIVEEGFALWESIAILEYLDERFTSGKPLYPGDAKARARIRRIGFEIQSYLRTEGVDPIVDEFFWKDGAPPDVDKVAKARAVLERELAVMARELQGDFLAGAEPTAADFMLYPEVGYVKRITFRKPESKLIELLPPEIAAWAKRIEALPYFDKTFPPHWK
jgi:glutathione S-transferase